MKDHPTAPGAGGPGAGGPGAGGPDEHASWLRGPYLGAEAAFVVARALTVRPPLVLHGEAGTGKRRIARAVHARSGTTLFLSLAGPDFSRAAVETAAASRRGTLFLDLARPLTPAGADELADLLDAGGSITTASGSRLRLVAATERDLAELADSGAFPRSLYHRLSILPVRLAALRDRRNDIPPIAEEMLGNICRTLGHPAPRLSASALDRLAEHPWFGNLAELESVLTRTLILRDAREFGADDLVFDHTPLLPTAAVPPPAGSAAARPQGPSLEMIVQELAHEFKNPLVTLKTFAQLTQRAAENSGGDAQFACLAAQAADRMDGVLENLLRFVGMQEPRLRPVRVADLFASGADGSPAGGWTLRPEGHAGAGVRADPEQVSFALANLLRALAGEPPGSGTISVRYEPPSTAVLVFPSANGGPASHLAALLDGDAEAEVPLGVAIARAVVERNGGTLTIRRQAQGLVAALTLTPDTEG